MARNRALLGAGDVDAVAFIDDDESPRPDWLWAMVREWRATDAEVLMGASMPKFEHRPPAWIVDGNYFQRPRFTTGEAVSYNFVRTSGVVIDRAALPDGPEVFAPDFRLSGGSDTHLFERMERAGVRFVWVDDAIVDDFVPSTRANVRWLLCRAFRVGNTRSLILIAKGASPIRRARRVVGTFCFGTIDCCKTLPSLRTGRPGLMKLGQAVANAAGQISGGIGFTYQEYKRVHGS
jgi:glycosyltransferase involved in cell wall biosynthesis